MDDESECKRLLSLIPLKQKQTTLPMLSHIHVHAMLELLLSEKKKKTQRTPWAILKVGLDTFLLQDLRTETS